MLGALHRRVRRRPDEANAAGNAAPPARPCAFGVAARLLEAWARRVFAIDPRSLRSFRIALGSLVLIDLWVRAGALAAHYSDRGLLPRQALSEEPSAALHFCLHAWSGSASYEALLFAAAGALAVAFALGRGGPGVAFALWALTVSLQNRNFMVLNKGDQILRLLLFWSMFLPSRSRHPVLSVGSAGLLIQAALVWLVSASLKTGRDWFPDGTATYYALQVDHGTTAFGRWIGGMFPVTRALTYGVYFLEWAAAFLLFSPVWTSRLRAVALAALTAMHLGFGLGMRLGLFPAFSVCSLLPFVPGTFHARLGHWRRKCRPEVSESALAGTATASDRRAGPASARAANALALAALLLVFWINLAALPIRHPAIPRSVMRAASMLRLDQNWAMFAPRPWRETNWYVVSGRLEDGRVVDAYHPSLKAPSRGEPRALSSTFPSARWLDYMTHLAMPENAREIPWFARYSCRNFDAAHLTAAPLQEIEIEIFRQWALPGYAKTAPREEILWRRSCRTGG